MAHHHDNLFEKLESSNKDTVENFKHSIREQFSKVQEPWLINGLYDYYLNSNSLRCMEMLITLREPHHLFLFDRLCESIKNPKTEVKVRVQALTLLGYIARSQPTWLYSLPEHALFKQILKFLINEAELIPLISALLLLIILLPMYPSYIGEHYLDDVFEIFRRLAAWNSQVPGKLGEDQMIHLQVALYALFLRLYGMYPCNFLSYLRSQFRDRNDPVFCHTIKPMMDTVKMHPSLVTTSKESETTTERWKKMGVHDVIVECERFSLDMTDRCPHDTCQNTTEFRSRSGTMNSTVGTGAANELSYHQQNLRSLASLQMGSEEGFSPSQVYQLKAPINEATGVTHRHIQGYINRTSYPLPQEGSPPEAAIEATPETTPVRDFTPAPMPTKSNVARALTSFRSNSGGYIVSGTPTNSVPSSPMRKEPSPFVFPAQGSVTLSQHLAHRLTQERQISELPTKPPPSSPLKILQGESSRALRPESPISQEDEEVSSISASRSETNKKVISRYCDSILPDIDDSSDYNKEEDTEHGSPCTAGGLHMPNSRSINSFKKRIRRLRYHSQCNPELDGVELSTGSSPGNGMPSSSNSIVRRANSCPDIKKSPHPTHKGNKTRPFYETDEETMSEDQSNGLCEERKKHKSMNSATQTEVFWPMPYEHLFLNIFPSLKEESAEIKPSPVPSPAPVLHQVMDPYRPSLYDILDKYIDNTVATIDNNHSLRDQVQLIHQHFLFERHRRETHAYRNRRLLSDAKNTRLLEEYNSALRDQVQLEQKEIDDLREQLEDYRKVVAEQQRVLQNSWNFLKEKCDHVEEENGDLQEIKKKMECDVAAFRSQCGLIDKQRQHAEAAVLDALADGKIAREQALAGDKFRQQLQRVNGDLLVMGELQVKYQEKLDKLLNKSQSDEGMRQLSETYREELKGLQQQIDAKTLALDAYKARLTELEHSISAKDEIIAGQKRTLTAASLEREAVLEAVESKYQSQLAINRVLEEHVLELRQKLEVEIARRRTQSPDTSSCQEVQTTQHSSPLSASLASSEGSAVMQQELKNLQMYVDQEGSSNEQTNQGKND
ncbi:hamartin-like isoform X1 [Euwallacea fornicatus]|uniref:hamartin-like isoform X1 n=1 Tax=Euwallacea fornicatus TaxID=995702 RepID=UPI00338EA33F